ncbi:MAG: hypothetical protein KBA30_06750, partial [Clostridia bacterium]|nr:hypothetical protein [Clostridia bacterium]
MRFLPSSIRSRKGAAALAPGAVADTGRNPREIVLYFFIVGLTGLAMGLSDSIFSNYFKDVYNTGAMARGFIELPRELPGLLCMAAVSILSGMGLGDMKTAMVAQLLMIVDI